MMLRVLSYVVTALVAFIAGVVLEARATKLAHREYGRDGCPVCHKFERSI